MKYNDCHYMQRTSIFIVQINSVVRQFLREKNMSKRKMNAFYAQSGGVTSVINASASGVIQMARQHPERINHIYAGRNGILGALREELFDTQQESASDIEKLKTTPGGAFGSCRYKLREVSSCNNEYKRIIDVFEAHDIGYFFYNGGGDSADTCLKIAQVSAEMGYPISAIHIPKTIDNDLPITDCSPGFGSVAKYVAISTKEASLDIASMRETSTKVFILEVMGRNAGWIAASAGLAASRASDPPHIILFPEIAFDQARFLERVRQTVDQEGFCVIVASEGITFEDGSPISGSGDKDAFGHQQLGGVAPTLADLIKNEMGYKHHWAKSDYLQRSARHIASATDVSQAYAAGQQAVERSLNGESSIMITIEREMSPNYQWSLGSAPLIDIANKEKYVPTDFIRPDGYGITMNAVDYLLPLIQGESYPDYIDGLPQYAKLKNKLVPKKLSQTFNLESTRHT